MVLLLASFVSILSCWNFDVLIFQFFQCFFGLHKQRGERRLPYYHGQYLNPMHAGKHGFLTFFFFKLFSWAAHQQVCFGHPKPGLKHVKLFQTHIICCSMFPTLEIFNVFKLLLRSCPVCSGDRQAGSARWRGRTFLWVTFFLGLFGYSW